MLRLKHTLPSCVPSLSTQLLSGHLTSTSTSMPWRRCRSEQLDGRLGLDGIDSLTVGLVHTQSLATTSSGSPSNSVTSYSVSARLSRSCMVLTVSISLITLLLNEDRFDPTLIPSQFPNPVLMPLDSLILWMLLLSGTNYHHLFSNHHLCSLLNSASASCSWTYLSLVSLDLSPPFPRPLYPMISCVFAVIVCLGEHNHRHCLSCNPFPTGIKFNSIQFNSIHDTREQSEAAQVRVQNHCSLTFLPCLSILHLLHAALGQSISLQFTPCYMIVQQCPHSV